MRVGFTMPAYNEEKFLPITVDGVLPLVEALVIVNDGSKDNTGAVADELARKHPDKIRVVHHPVNRGVGAGIVTGVKALLERGDLDAIGLTASDNQCDPALIPRFRQILESEPDIEVAKGSRFLHPDSLHNMPRFRMWGNRGVSAAMSLALGYWGMSDVLHGYMLVRTSLFRRVNLGAIAEGYDMENTLTAEFRRLGASFALIPSPSRYADEVSDIVLRKQIPKTIGTFSRIVGRRMMQGPDRAGLLLLLSALPTMGMTLPVALARMKLKSPKVRRYPV
jgi:glycosyltransferase involved in cell wall biosynthesis